MTSAGWLATDQPAQFQPNTRDWRALPPVWDFYRKSLAIARELKDQREMADAYHQPGDV